MPERSMAMTAHDPSSLSLTICEHHALYRVEGAANALTLKPIQPSGFDPRRHYKQLEALEKLQSKLEALPTTAALPSWPAMPYAHRYQGYEVEGATITSYRGKQLFSHPLYLFNVLVALEWVPSPSTVEQLIVGFRAASDFLFDATNGWMAFGQVVFGGMELMPGADIQIMASNRLHPRSWLDGLHDPGKYMAVRVGRGVWYKKNRILIRWDEPEAYRTLVHEWGHYALNLLDEYLDTEKPYVYRKRWPYRLLDKDQAQKRRIPVPDDAPRLVVPKTNLAVESIMATVEASEIVPQQRRAGQERNEEIRKHYPDVDLTGPYDQGPHHLPLPLPRFYTSSDQFGNPGLGEELLVDVDDVALEHCWVYLLRWHGQNGGRALRHIIAQGSLDDRARPSDDGKGNAIPGAGFLILGAQEGDELLFIGTDRDSGVLKAELRSLGAAGPEKRPLTPAIDVTPAAFPVLTVVPNRVKPAAPGQNTILITELKVQIASDTPPDDVWLCPFAQDPKPGAWPKEIHRENGPASWESTFIEVPHLDGQVLVRWRGAGTEPDRLMVCDYSQGGGPDSHIKAPEPPITAGSSDGNVMFFFTPHGKGHELNPQYSEIRIVTTRNFGGFEQANETTGAPRSYLFSVASSKAIPAEELSPTLVMHFDTDALDDEGQIVICRYNEQDSEWEVLPTYQPPAAFYAALPLTSRPDGTQPLDPDGAHSVEHYRIFLV
jgi:hypothetical protein